MPSKAPGVCVCCRQRPAAPAWHPFCSERCRLLDLERWIDGDYRIAGEPAPVPPDAADPADA